MLRYRVYRCLTTFNNAAFYLNAFPLIVDSLVSDIMADLGTVKVNLFNKFISGLLGKINIFP